MKIEQFREKHKMPFLKQGMMFEQSGRRGIISCMHNGKLKARWKGDIYSFDFVDFKRDTVYYDQKMNVVKDYRL